MLHHVSLEIPVGEAERSIEFWRSLGFEPVPVPAELGPNTHWLERAGTQIHLIERDEPMVPQVGHLAVVVADYDRAIERLATAGYEVAARRELWDEPRAKVTAPGGHVVELMRAAPG